MAKSGEQADRSFAGMRRTAREDGGLRELIARGDTPRSPDVYAAISKLLRWGVAIEPIVEELVYEGHVAHAARLRARQLEGSPLFRDAVPPHSQGDTLYALTGHFLGNPRALAIYNRPALDVFLPAASARLDDRDGIDSLLRRDDVHMAELEGTAAARILEQRLAAGAALNVEGELAQIAAALEQDRARARAAEFDWVADQLRLQRGSRGGAGDGHWETAWDSACQRVAFERGIVAWNLVGPLGRPAREAFLLSLHMSDFRGHDAWQDALVAAFNAELDALDTP